MSSAYKFSNPTGIYFVSIATVEWVDVFTRKEYVKIVLESLKHCQKEKGLTSLGESGFGCEKIDKSMRS